jgi:subtilisin family serine protease
MKSIFLKPALFAATAGLLLASCGAPNLAVEAEPIQMNAELALKNAELGEEQLKAWLMADLVADTIPGMSVEKAYNEIIEPAKVEGETVIVAVLDSGTDIEHEDLDGVIWTNEDEIPNNNIDDDKNGYVDDIHGWNFLGDIVGANLNFTRIVRQFKPKFEGKTEAEISPENKEEYELYQRAKTQWEKEHAQATQRKQQFEMLVNRLNTAHESLSKEIGKEDFTAEELQAMETESDTLQMQKMMMLSIMQQVDGGYASIQSQMQDGLNYFNDQLQYHLNLDFKAREILGDDYHDWSAQDYGDNDVDGPEEDEAHVKHGTHVAGIIAAERNNGIGMNGVANNAEIMVIRAVPNGDEYDKDIALGIRYAVDNGAKIINASFGKSFSSHSDWVIDALKYAAEKDVLFVHAAGNDALDLDKEGNRNYPNDQWPGQTEEVTSNVLTVGALNYKLGEGLAAPFSNYGASSVDVFAPGMEIYSTTPLDKYEFLQGTSMAAPAVAGVAAVIRSYYPKLSAEQVKQIIMESGIPVQIEVMVPGGEEQLQSFSTLSVSGKIANLYNALILADNMAD